MPTKIGGITVSSSGPGKYSAEMTQREYEQMERFVTGLSQIAQGDDGKLYGSRKAEVLERDPQDTKNSRLRVTFQDYGADDSLSRKDAIRGLQKQAYKHQYEKTADAKKPVRDGGKSFTEYLIERGMLQENESGKKYNVRGQIKKYKKSDFESVFPGMSVAQAREKALSDLRAAMRK